MIEFKQDTLSEDLIKTYADRFIRDFDGLLTDSSGNQTWILEYFTALLHKYIRERSKSYFSAEIKLKKIHRLGKRMYDDMTNYTTDSEREIKMLGMESNVNHPAHYVGAKLEAIDVIEDFDLGFNLGNALKYIVRCEKKGNKQEDLEKAIFYLTREMSKISS